MNTILTPLESPFDNSGDFSTNPSFYFAQLELLRRPSSGGQRWGAGELEDVVGSAGSLLHLGHDSLLGDLLLLADVNEIDVVGLEEGTDGATLSAKDGALERK